MFAVENVADHKSETFTPTGYADRDFAWLTDEEAIVSRSVESELVNVSNRPLPRLYRINTLTNEGKWLTKPVEGIGDFHPAIQQERLVWIRTDRKDAKVMYSNLDGAEEKVWINNVDLGTWYYEYWYWDEVFALYQGQGK